MATAAAAATAAARLSPSDLRFECWKLVERMREVDTLGIKFVALLQGRARVAHALRAIVLAIPGDTPILCVKPDTAAAVLELLEQHGNAAAVRVTRSPFVLFDVNVVVTALLDWEARIKRVSEVLRSELNCLLDECSALTGRPCPDDVAFRAAIVACVRETRA